MSAEDDKRLRATLVSKNNPEISDGEADREARWMWYVRSLDADDTAWLRTVLDRVMNDASRTWAEKYDDYVSPLPDYSPYWEEESRTYFERTWLLAFGTPWREGS